ncbi:helix-turn-helix transcriptional regulator [Runella slithyformis]|nr:WYL domain-containing protein [Runella slithyformis]
MKKIIQTQYERFQKINERLNRWKGQVVHKTELMRLCECSERTIKQDIADMRTLYDAPIDYDFKVKGYFYRSPFDLEMRVHLTKNELAALEAAVGTLTQFSHLEPFRELQSAVSKLDQAVKYRFRHPNGESRGIQFENVPLLPGGELIGPLLEAIRGRQWVRFSYRKFENELADDYDLFPYLLKEHRNRWYLLGWARNRKGIRTFGLERINPLSLQRTDIVDEAPAFDAGRYFEKAMGVAIYEDRAPEEVILSFTPFQANYFKTQPFFPYRPEQVLVDDAAEFRVRLHLIINKELVYELARMGADVCVLAPEQLVREMRDFHRKAVERYAVLNDE